MEVIKRFGGFLLGNSWKAGLVAFLLSATPILGIPFVSWLSYVIVAFVTLRKGFNDGVIVFGFSVILPLCFGLMLGDVIVIIHQVFAGSLAVLLFSMILRSTAQWRYVIEAAAWLGLIAVLLVHLFISDLDAWWYTEISETFTAMGRFTGMDPAVAQPIIDAELAMLVPIATGFSTAWLLLVSLINVGIARWWQAVMFNPVGLRPELLSIRLGPSILVGFGATLAVGAFIAPIGWDCLPPFIAALGVAGLSVVHYYFDKRKSAIGLVIFYLAFILVSPYVGGFVVLIALNDSVLNLRMLKKEG